MIHIHTDYAKYDFDEGVLKYSASALEDAADKRDTDMVSSSRSNCKSDPGFAKCKSSQFSVNDISQNKCGESFDATIPIIFPCLHRYLLLLYRQVNQVLTTSLPSHSAVSMSSENPYFGDLNTQKCSPKLAVEHV
jgi:hypothetical protein